MSEDKKKLYLSGPMAGIQDFNFPAFHAMADELRQAGYEVINPAEINTDHNKPWEECLRNDIRELCGCDAIALMPGWENSKGANLELHLAHRLGLEVMHLPIGFDLISHLHRQSAWSEKTFGPGDRIKDVTDHLEKELIEVRDSNGDLSEWVDVIILGLDGAWRSGATPEEIAAAIEAKQTKNENRDWRDWRTADPDKAIEHVRTNEKAA